MSTLSNFRIEAIIYAEKAVQILNDSVDKNNPVLIETKLNLLRLYNNANQFNKSWELLSELKELNLSALTILNNENISLLLRESRLLHKVGRSKESLDLLYNKINNRLDDYSLCQLYEEKAYIESELKMYSEALTNLDTLKTIYKKTLNNILNPIIALGIEYKIAKQNIAQGKIIENTEQQILHYIKYLSNCYLPPFPEMETDRIWSLLRHDAILYNMDFECYPDFKFINHNPKTDFVWKYNALIKEQNSQNPTPIYHEYALLVDGKKYSKRDLYKLMIDFWILCYRPDDEDLIDAYDSLVNFYKLLNKENKVMESIRFRETAIINGLLVKKLIEERKSIIWPIFLNEAYNEFILNEKKGE